jgi:hypothetical protein
MADDWRLNGEQAALRRTEQLEAEASRLVAARLEDQRRADRAEAILALRPNEHDEDGFEYVPIQRFAAEKARGDRLEGQRDRLLEAVTPLVALSRDWRGGKRDVRIQGATVERITEVAEQIEGERDA